MAVQVEVHLICDYCVGTDQGSKRGTTTTKFGLHGQNYEVDVCDKHLEQLDQDLATWVRVGRRAGTKPREIGRQARARKATATTAKKGKKYDPEDVRLWAKLKGIRVNETPGARLNPRLIRQYLDEVGVDEAARRTAQG